MSAPGELTDRYLDELLARLRGPAREVRRMLTETEAHLRDDTAAGVRDGLDPMTAERRAVDRFGSPATVSRRHNRTPAFRRARVGALVRHLGWLTGVGLTAIGVSGLVALLMGGIGGWSFVWAGAPGARYPRGACAYWQSMHPLARSCAQAYLAESTADGFLYRAAAGVLGVLILLAVGWARRRKALAAEPAALSVITMTAGATLFAAAGAVLLGMGVDAVSVSSGNGAGQWLSGGIVSLATAAAFALLLRRRYLSDQACAVPS
jgi:HAAS